VMFRQHSLSVVERKPPKPTNAITRLDHEKRGKTTGTVRTAGTTNLLSRFVFAKGRKTIGGRPKMPTTFGPRGELGQRSQILRRQILGNANAHRKGFITTRKISGL